MVDQVEWAGVDTLVLRVRVLGMRGTRHDV